MLKQVAYFFLITLQLVSNYLVAEEKSSTTNQDQAPYSVIFYCPDNRSIKAKLFEIPVPYAEIELSNGRKENLAQKLSASGTRYTNVTETVEFWIKGNEATFSEGLLGEDNKIILGECKTND